MRSRGQYIITKDEVHGYANHWLSMSLKLEYEGRKCTASILLQILLVAASRTVSIFAACRDLADAHQAAVGRRGSVVRLIRVAHRALYGGP